MLLGGDVVIPRMLDGDGVASAAAEPAGLLAGIGIDLNEVAARQLGFLVIPRLHLGDGDAVLVNGNLVAQLIAALVFAIHDDIDGLAPGRVGHSYALAYLKGKAVAHQGLVAPIIDERPLLRLRRTFHGRVLEHAMALAVGKLDAPRLLWEAP